jgi:hypothetical protein
MTENNKRDVSQEQWQRLLNDLPNLSQQPIGEHLDDELMIGYVTETLTVAETERVDAHLSSCLECTTAIEHLFELSSAWQGDAGAWRLEDLSQRILQRIKRPSSVERDARQANPPLPQQLAQLLKQVEAGWRHALVQRPSQPLLASSNRGESETIWEDNYSLEDVTLYGRATLDSRGNLTLHFSSNRLDLEGKRINLHLELFEGKLQFEAESSTDVGATLVIPKRLVPEDLSQLRIELESEA